MLVATKQVIGAKTETTQNTAATFAATDYALAEMVLPDLDVEELKRNYFRSSLSNLTAGRGKAKSTIKIRMELKGSGTAGTAYAPLNALFIAAGMTETVVAVTSVTLAPTSAAASSSYSTPGKSCTIEWYASDLVTSGLKMVFAGCVGSWELVAESGKIAMVEFTMTGHYGVVTDAALPSTTYLAQAPKEFSSSTISIHTLAAIVRKWQINYNTTIAERDDAASANSVKGFLVTGRDPGGSISLEGEKVATHDFYGKMKSGAEASASFTLAGSAGNIITVTTPKTQYRKIGLSNANGILLFEDAIAINQSTGDDEISIAFT